MSFLLPPWGLFFFFGGASPPTLSARERKRAVTEGPLLPAKQHFNVLLLQSLNH